MMNNKKIDKVFKLLDLTNKEKRDRFINLELGYLKQKNDSHNYYILSTSNSLKEHQENA
jgi:aspartate/tyrosine/aromatic aminotransferase